MVRSVTNKSNLRNFINREEIKVTDVLTYALEKEMGKATNYSQNNAR